MGSLFLIYKVVRSVDMENKIYYISWSEIDGVRDRYQKDKSYFIAELNGRSIKTLHDYFEAINKLFKFPIPSFGFDGYLDWMRDLSWLGKDGYALLITSFNTFLIKDFVSKNKITMYFEKAILPFWQKEVEKVVVDGKAKPFIVYLVQQININGSDILWIIRNTI